MGMDKRAHVYDVIKWRSISNCTVSLSEVRQMILCCHTVHILCRRQENMSHFIDSQPSHLSYQLLYKSRKNKDIANNYAIWYKTVYVTCI